MKSIAELGFASSIALILLECAYIIALWIGLAYLPSPEAQIQDPWFTTMELLILAIAPTLVVLMSTLYFTAEDQKKIFGLISLLFMVAVCIITTCLHFSILGLSRHEAFLEPPWSTIVFPFEWPSVSYAIDIVAWDVFWPLSMLFSAFTLGVSRVEKWIKALMLVSAALSAAGLLGVITGDMSHRNIGIVGYVPVFVAILILLAYHFSRFRRNGA